MYPSFTGNSRRPRQVNLSGRTSNPFAATSNTKDVLASAQQDRAARQKERERLSAARNIQRVWRGHRDRRKLSEELRRLWDAKEYGHRRAEEQNDEDHASKLDGDEAQRDVEDYASAEESLAQLRLLLAFVNVRNRKDRQRMDRYVARQEQTILNYDISCTGGPWPMAYLRLERTCLAAMERDSVGGQALLHNLRFVAEEIPEYTAQKNAREYYRVLKKIYSMALQGGESGWIFSNALMLCILAPIQTNTLATLPAYEELASLFLTSDFVKDPQVRVTLAVTLDHTLLARAVAKLVTDPTAAQAENLAPVDARISLLATLIWIGRRASDDNTDINLITAISGLLSSTADQIDIERTLTHVDQDRDNRSRVWRGFVAEQILSLVNQRSIGGLLVHAGPRAPAAPQLANYALTLLRVFPRRGDEIRMWLYLGSTSATQEKGSEGHSAIKYFWMSARSTAVFRLISKDSRTAIDLLKARRASAAAPNNNTRYEVNDEWSVIFIFFELYSFVLKFMDDEEFFSGVAAAVSGSPSWTRGNALELDDIKDLITFLKNLGFTIYFNASDIVGDSETEDESARGLSSYFNISSSGPSNFEGRRESRPVRQAVGGIIGLSLDYVKGLVTGMLRSIYERDSRRQFLPKGHWLMTSRFDMEGFIPAVVAEEESRRKVRHDDAEEQEDGESEPETEESEYPRYVGTHRVQQTRNFERLQRQQRKASRKRYLQAVAPRQEILQNMPFFIPFETRVQIFREFVLLDMKERRNGFPDPDMWRMSLVHGRLNNSDSLEIHHAKIRRKHEFEDAFRQFYPLGPGLKEPIQITFVDEFDIEEVGIDGGGVTKEFLTSVSSQAFSPSDTINLFVENEQHLLYPNPSALDEPKVISGLPDNSPDLRAVVHSLMQRYEFLGRIVGKCLYEGILVDVNFAGFFLMKWALTGGTGSAPRESGYRANLNDLRDLDEGLYQGLLKLKNYSGDVEDFGLNFTVTDLLRTPFSPSSITDSAHLPTTTRELQPNGSAIPVTNANRILYISLMARHRLATQPFPQTAAFLRGLSSIVEPAWLSMFNRTELQTLLSGTRSAISIPDLRAHTQYSGVYVPDADGALHPVIDMFWRVMEALSDEDTRKVLKFVTSVARAPLLGFGALNPRFSIRDSGSDESRLPSTSTCVNLLKLPRYGSERVLREKLLYAVNAGAGFDLS